MFSPKRDYNTTSLDGLWGGLEQIMHTEPLILCLARSRGPFPSFFVSLTIGKVSKQSRLDKERCVKRSGKNLGKHGTDSVILQRTHPWVRLAYVARLCSPELVLHICLFQHRDAPEMQRSLHQLPESASGRRACRHSHTAPVSPWLCWIPGILLQGRYCHSVSSDAHCLERRAERFIICPKALAGT